MVFFAYSELHWTLEACLQRVRNVHESGLFLWSTLHKSGLPLCQHSVWVQALVSLCLLSHFSPLKIRMREDAEMQRTRNFPAQSEFPWQHHPAITTQHRIILQYQHHPAISTHHNIILQYQHHIASSNNIKTMTSIKEFQICFMSPSFWYRCNNECP